MTRRGLGETLGAMRMFGAALRVCMVLAGLVALVASSTAKKGANETGSGSGSAKVAVDAGPPIDITALDLLEAYKTNEVGADEKYEHKIVRVTGKVGRIAKTALDDPYVALATSLGDIQAMVGTGAGALKRGQQVTLRCECKGLSLGTLLLEDCTIEK